MKLQVMSNSKLSEHFLALARDLDVMEAKTPEVSCCARGACGTDKLGDGVG